MAIRVQTRFIRRATVRVIVYVYDDDEALVDATSVDLTVKDPDGTIVVNEQAMSKTATGTYEYFYTTTTSSIEGDHQILADITDSSYHTYQEGHFSLEAGIDE